MIYTQVFVNGFELDGVEQVDIAFSYSLKDIRDIGAAKGSRSTSITIPRTKNNNIAFGIASDINAFTTTNKNAGLPAYCLGSSNVIADGVAFLLEVTQTEITFAILESIGALKSDIGEAMLFDLDLSDLDHTYDDTDVFDTWANDYDYIYPLIDYGKFRFRPAGVTPTVHTEVKPAVKDERIIRQICRDAGITLQTEFFNNPVHKGLITAFGNGEMVHPQSWVDDRKVYVRNTANVTYPTTGTPIIFDTEVTDPLNEFDTTTWEYTSNEGKVATIRMTFVTSNAFFGFGVVPRMQLEYYDTTLAGWFDVDGGGIEDVSVSQLYEINTTVNLLNAWRIRATINFDGAPFAGTIDIADARLYITPEDTVYTQSTVSLSYQLPKWTQLDYLKDFAGQFNMILLYDSATKVLRMDTWNDYYSGLSVDWSDKLNLIESPVISYNQSDIPSVWGFEYDQPSNDRRLTQFNEKYADAILFGNGSYSLETTYGEAKKVVESKMRPVYSARSYDTAILVPGTRFADYIVIPNVWETNQTVGEANYACGPMRLIYQGMVDVSILSEGTRQSIDITSSSTVQLTIPLCYFVKRTYNDTDIDSWDLNLCFDMPPDEGIINIWNGTGLIDRYYSELLYNMDNFRMIKVRLNLTSSDIAQLDLSKYIYLDYFRAYFIVNKIEQFNPNDNESTEVELIRVAR